MKRSFAALLIVVLALPFSVQAKEKKHVRTDGQECSECHGGEADAWGGGKHGLMNVKCVVCHGSPEEDFTARPGIYKCRGCHGEKVADVERRLPKQQRTCFRCHDNHLVTVKTEAVAKSGFHREGGAR